jgi:pantetheine-phosphate adenylyltransferase
MVTAIYPGTFDPITQGHVDIAQRAALMFDKLIFAVAESKRKNTLFSNKERLVLASNVLSEIENVEVLPFHSLVTDFAKEKGATVIVRGIRAVADFDYEFQMAGMNRQLAPEVETIFLSPDENLSSISSSLVKEISSFGGDVSKFVHPSVLIALKEKHNQ